MAVSMQRELLMCLLGFGGDMFAAVPYLPEHHSCRWRRPRFALHDAALQSLEREVLASLLPIASAHAAVAEFVQEHGLFAPSLYLAALSDELDHELQAYRDAVLQTERELEVHPAMPFVHVRERMLVFEPLLRSMVDTVASIMNEKLLGGALLNRLHAAAQSGVPVVRESMLRIMQRCHQVLFNHLIAWAVFGVLPQGAAAAEFFIVAEGEGKAGGGRKDVVPPVAVDTPAVIGGVTVIGADSTHRSKPSTDAEAGRGSAGSASRAGVGADVDASSTLSLDTPGVTINLSALPSRYIPLRLAECVLFIGKAVRLLSRPAVSLRRADGDGDAATPRGGGDATSTVSDAYHSDDESTVGRFDDDGDDRTSVGGAPGGAPTPARANNALLSQRDVDTFYQQLTALKHAPAFHLLSVECTFDRIRDVVASRLWQLLVVESRLLEHLTTLKRNYLLALLPDAVESTAEVHVVYEVKSPLHLVISPTSLQRYDELFQFMLRLKRVSNALQESWGTMIHSKRTVDWVLLRPLWLLRTRMSFVVTNLQGYLELDVVESGFAKLKQAFATSQDFNVVRRAHDSYLQHLVTKAMLRHPVMTRAVSDILTTCSAFAAFVAKNAGDLRQCMGVGAATLRALEADFRKQTNFLFETQRAAPKSVADSSLMLRMDFTDYFHRQAAPALWF